MRGLFRKTALVLCAAVLLTGYAHVSFADAMTDMEAFFSRKESLSGMMDVPGKGPMRYYAQNDELWGALCYEKENTNTRRPFRDSGCSPSSLAMAVAALIPAEELPKIGNYAKTPYSLCSCSLTKARCTHSHTRYVLTSQRDYERFLPLVFGDFAIGNNQQGVVSRASAAGTGTAYLGKIAEIYGLNMRTLTNYRDVKDLVTRKDVAVVALAGKGGAFTTTGHYVFLAGADDEFLYVFDPMLRTDYHGYKNGSKLQVVKPGLVALKHIHNSAAQFGSFIVFERMPTL